MSAVRPTHDKRDLIKCERFCPQRKPPTKETHRLEEDLCQLYIL